MAAHFDTYQLLTEKIGCAIAAMTCAGALISVNARTRFALAGGGAP
jgi:hypothetical protein